MPQETETFPTYSGSYRGSSESERVLSTNLKVKSIDMSEFERLGVLPSLLNGLSAKGKSLMIYMCNLHAFK